MATDLRSMSIFRKLLYLPNMCRFGRLGIHYLLIILLGSFMIFDLRYMGLKMVTFSNKARFSKDMKDAISTR